jgi:HAE1 family hydrophobic/amphiphilic exporter-1
MVGPMAVAMVIAVFLVYTVMVLQFERFKQPFLIMGSIPFCFIGAVIGLLVFGSTVNMLSLLGLITLSGIVVNNGIILVDYINQLRKQRREEIARERGTQNRDGEWEIVLSEQEENDLTRQCILDGASSRLRPILITTLTTLLGDIPMAISKGEGAEIYAPMGQVIIGGLLSSTLITLVIIPVLYEIMEKKKKAKKSI